MTDSTTSTKATVSKSANYIHIVQCSVIEMVHC